MYGLPKDFDGGKLAGRFLQQICFGLAQIQLRFDESLVIAVESAFLYKESRSSKPALRINIPGAPADQCMLLQLLHHTILDASGNAEGTLILRFDNGDVLQCLDRPYYEAYQITQGDDLTVV